MTAAMPQPISMTTRPAKKLWAIMDPPMNRDRAPMPSAVFQGL